MEMCEVGNIVSPGGLVLIKNKLQKTCLLHKLSYQGLPTSWEDLMWRHESLIMRDKPYLEISHKNLPLSMITAVEEIDIVQNCDMSKKNKIHLQIKLSVKSLSEKPKRNYGKEFYLCFSVAFLLKSIENGDIEIILPKRNKKE